MIYEKPEFCILFFENKDVITSSMLQDGGIGNDDELELDDSWVTQP